MLLLLNYRIIHYIQLYQTQDIGLATCWSWVILKSPKTLSVCKKWFWACDGKERVKNLNIEIGRHPRLFRISSTSSRLRKIT